MRSRLNFLAWTILVTVYVGMSVYLILNPTRTGVVPNYRFAASHWWISESMYPGGTHGFLYAPTVRGVVQLAAFPETGCPR